MANIRIAEVEAVHHDTSDDGAVPVFTVGDGETFQTVAIGAASAQSGVLTKKYAEIYAENACFLTFGDNPTAAAGTGFRMAADTTKSVAIYKPGITKVAVIQD